MTNNVIQLSDYKPHISGEAICIGCNHKWDAIAPCSTTELECPECHTNKGRFMNLVLMDELHYTCKCENQFFHITPTGTYCPNCGDWLNIDEGGL